MKPGYSLRAVSWTIWVALAFPLLARALTLAATASSKDWDKLERWFALSHAAAFTSALLLALGMLELAKRQVLTSRATAVAGACILLVHVGWIALELGVAIVHPEEGAQSIYTWDGRFALVAEVASIILLAVAGDAWRRLPIAPIVALALVATSYSMPIIGPAIDEQFADNSIVERNAYLLIRQCIDNAAWLFIAGALAARGHVIPAPTRAHAGFQLARGALIVRIFAAILFALVALSATKATPNTVKLMLLGVPVIAVLTSLLVGIGLVQVAASHVDGLPRASFVLGATGILWWTFVQVRQIGLLWIGLRGDAMGLPEFVESEATLFSTAGPLVATIGMVVAAIAIHSYATRTDNTQLISKATSATGASVALMLAALLMQSGVVTVETRTGAITLLLAIATANIGATLVYAGLLGYAARSVDHPPSNLPSAVARRVG